MSIPRILKLIMSVSYQTVRLSYSSERTVTEVAQSLGITTNMIYLWRKKYTPEGDKTQLAQMQDGTPFSSLYKKILTLSTLKLRIKMS